MFKLQQALYLAARRVMNALADGSAFPPHLLKFSCLGELGGWYHMLRVAQMDGSNSI